MYERDEQPVHLLRSHRRRRRADRESGIRSRGVVQSQMSQSFGVARRRSKSVAGRNRRFNRRISLGIGKWGLPRPPPQARAPVPCARRPRMQIRVDNSTLPSKYPPLSCAGAAPNHRRCSKEPGDGDGIVGKGCHLVERRSSGGEGRDEASAVGDGFPGMDQS